MALSSAQQAMPGEFNPVSQGAGGLAFGFRKQAQFLMSDNKQCNPKGGKRWRNVLARSCNHKAGT